MGASKIAMQIAESPLVSAQSAVSPGSESRPGQSPGKVPLRSPREYDATDDTVQEAGGPKQPCKSLRAGFRCLARDRCQIARTIAAVSQLDVRLTLSHAIGDSPPSRVGSG